MIWKRIVIREMERGLVTVNGRLREVLQPGVHRMWTLERGLAVEVHRVFDAVLTAVQASDWARAESELIDIHFRRVLVAEGEVAVIFADGLIQRVLGPGESALVWKEPRAIEVRVFDAVAEAAVEAALVPALTRLGPAAARAQFVSVPEQMAGLIFVNGRLLRRVEAGLHAFWSLLGAVRAEIVDLRRQVLEVTGQEILTKDKVSLRVNLSAEFRVIDPVLKVRSVTDAGETLRRHMQLAARRTLGTRTLDELLLNRVDIDPEVASAIAREMLTAGVEVTLMAIKDVVLPGEIREILNQVVAAEKRAQANLIQRREETAATRSLLNTAKLMEDSPVLMRLKELETLEKLTEKVGSITVTGGFEGMLEKLLPGARK